MLYCEKQKGGIFMIDHCIYCGDWYECRDHVIPISWQQTYRDYKPGSTVKCCKECNSFLGNKPFHTIQSRATYLINAYLINRKKDFNFPNWEANEIRELGYNLRTSVLNKLARKKVYLRKLENLEFVSNGYECKPFRVDLEKDSTNTLSSSKKCLNCGSIYYNAKNNQFCSIYCTTESKAKMVNSLFPTTRIEEVLLRVENRKCIVCETDITSRKNTVYYCSSKCRNIIEKENSVKSIV